MYDASSLLPDEAHLRIDDRVRRAAADRTARTARATRPPAAPGRRRHRLAQQLRSVADRLDV